MRAYYQDDWVTLFHARCEAVLPMLPIPDLVIADPPYGMGQAAQKRTRRAKHDQWKDGEWRSMQGDNEPFDPSHLLHYPRLVLFGANHYADRLPASRSWLVWDKRDGVAPDDNADAELIWTNIDGVVRMYRQCWRGFARRGVEQAQKHLHPTQKPVALMKWIIERYTKPGDLIIDPYAGSGPVLVAAKELGRRAIGCEIELQYCQTAAARLYQDVFDLQAQP